MRTLVVCLVAVLCGSSVASSQTPAIGAGTYDLTVTYGGGQLDGVLGLEFKGDSTVVTLTVGGHTPTFRKIVRQGSKLTLIGGAEGMLVEYDLTFDGDTVTGTLSFNGSDGTVTGARRKPRTG